MAQDYTMTAAGLSPATSPEYRAQFARANRLAALATRGTSCTSGAAVVLSEDIEPGEPRKPIPIVYPDSILVAYEGRVKFDAAKHLEDYGPAWIPATRGTMIVRYRGADGGKGVVRMPMPAENANDVQVAEWQARKSEYLARLTRGSGPIDSRSVVSVLREEAAGDAAPKVRRTRAKATAAPTEAPPTAAPSAELDALRAAMARVTEERDELRAEVARLTADLTEARTAADTDEADLVRAAETIADLRAEVAGLRAMRLTPRIGVPPPVVRA